MKTLEIESDLTVDIESEKTIIIEAAGIWVEITFEELEKIYNQVKTELNK